MRIWTVWAGGWRSRIPNCRRLCLHGRSRFPLIDSGRDRAIAQAETVVSRFSGLYRAAWLDGARARLGLRAVEDGDEALIETLYTWMQDAGADHTNTFAALCRPAIAEAPPFDHEHVPEPFREPPPPDSPHYRTFCGT